MIEPGGSAPEFTLPNHRGEPVSLADFRGRKVMLCFYPNDFSPVCSDQLSIYQEVLGEIRDRGAELVGISTDGSWAHNAFRKHLGLEMTLLSDFHPKGEVCRLYDTWREGDGFSNRAVFVVDKEGKIAYADYHELLDVPKNDEVFEVLSKM